MPKVDTTKFYLNAIKKHGHNAKGLNWSSKENQELRFHKIVQLLPPQLNAHSLGDAGCGFGDFYHYLKKKNKKPASYLGVDSLSDMVSIALDNTLAEILHLDICKEALPVKDYYICSGALNILNPFETHFFIQNCYNSSRKAFIFNALYGDKKSDTYNYVSKETLESIAKQLNVKKVIYKEGYLENDITVVFEK